MFWTAALSAEIWIYRLLIFFWQIGVGVYFFCKIEVAFCLDYFSVRFQVIIIMDISKDIL